jgi:hypothetical protein
MAHPLDGALARISRADTEFCELETLLDKFVKENQGKTLSQYNPRLSKGLSILPQSGVRRFNLPPVPAEASLIVGHVIYNLRAGLDYLIHELAIEDSGSIQEKTQFVIADAKGDSKGKGRGFDTRAQVELKGLSPEHIAMIESLQPYNGVQWTAILRDISNADKHRKLTAMWGSEFIAHSVQIGPSGSFEGRPGTTLHRVGGGQEVHIDTDSVIHIGFPERDNIPVIETLQVLKREVRSTVDAFKVEFK